MSDRARRKEKQRLKRKEKQLALRKAKSISPIRQIAHLGDSLECWINGNWKQTGMANLLVFGETRSGRGAMAAFLIDVWCVGLKDAWGRPEMSRMEFLEDGIEAASQQMPMRQIDVDEAREMVAAAIRFSQQNHFRLPRHYDRWIAIFGGLGDIATADLADFGSDGGLLFTGDVNFLRQRYTGGTAEEFLNREDVHWVMPPDDVNALYASDEDEKDEDGWDDEEEAGNLAQQISKVGEVIDDAADYAIDAVRSWCAKEGRLPHPQLEEAMSLMMTSMALAAAGGPKGEEGEFGLQLIQQIINTQNPQMQVELNDALKQVAEFVEKFGFPVRRTGRDAQPAPTMLIEAPSDAT